jgi:LPPG:FO 2-phospho-L-lactate transferase
MIAIFSGGTGTPKLLWGLKEILDDFCVVVNTGEDVWVSGNKVCPDIDSVIYTLAGIIDTEKWWGVERDTFITHEHLKKIGHDEGMKIGDLDRCTHIFRSELLRSGKSLVEATRILKKGFGIKQDIFPMCNEEVSTIIETEYGDMHFQEFWVLKRGEPEVKRVKVKGVEDASIPEEVKKALDNCKTIIIGPSNPVTSIGPIISVPGYGEVLKTKKVIAVSPLIGNQPVSGPAGKFMQALNVEVSPGGVARIYRDFLDVLVVDRADEDLKLDDIEVVATSTIMKSKEDAIKLAEFLLSLI